MLRSLRARFFLISWPLVVVAVVAVAAAFDRWTRIELQAFEEINVPEGALALEAPLGDSIAAHWTDLLQGGGPILDRLARALAPDHDLVLISGDGSLFLSTDPTLQVGPANAEPDPQREFTQRWSEDHAELAERSLVLSGTLVRGGDGGPLGYLYTIPRSNPAQPISLVTAESLQAGARRLLLAMVLIASMVAAAAAFLLSEPLVRRVGRLRSAAMELGSGALGTRVPEHGSDELAQLARSFNAMADALQRAETHKRNLVTDVAHELRTPLTNVVGLLEAIEDGLRPPDADTLRSIRDEARLLTALVDELQDLSLAESGQLSLDLQPVDALAAAQAAVIAVREGAARSHLLSPTARGPVLVLADPRRLAQILRNLLVNAITHTPEGGTIRVEVEGSEDRVALRVIDPGQGIPPDQVPLIWERFYRVDPSRQRGSGGMGLGLALVRQLVEAMGGSVAVQSALGVGSTFEVFLPRANGSPSDSRLPEGLGGVDPRRAKGG